MKAAIKRVALWFGKQLLEFAEQKVVESLEAKADKNPGKDATAANDA